MRVDISFERVIENITRNSETFTPFLDIDEWGFRGKSSSLCYCYIEMSGQKFVAKQKENGPGGKLVYKVDPISVPSKASIRFIGKFSEFRRRNGEVSLGWGTATVNPVVRVSLPEGFSHTCSFGIPGEQIEASRIDKNHELHGTQFPGQETKIRWWPDNCEQS